jgi:hypothetical protein
MFCYPPRPWIPTRDNLISDLPCLPTMPSAAGLGLGTETAITTEYLAMRLDHLIELLQDCLGVTGDDDVLAKGYDIDDLQSSGGDSVILHAADDAGDSSSTRIAEGANHADEGGGSAVPSGVGSLLRTGDVLDMAGDLLGEAVSVSVHHATADDQAVWQLVVVWADDKFTQRMLIIVAPNLLVVNATVHPIIGMHVNLCIKYVGYCWYPEDRVPPHTSSKSKQGVGRASTHCHVRCKLRTTPPCRGRLRRRHVSRGPGPRLLVEVSSGAVMCPSAPDLVSLTK